MKWRLIGGISLLIGGMVVPARTIAQVIPDATLSTTVNQAGNNFTIDAGNRVGNHLFHSFGQFSVPTGGAAIFNNAVDVQNIFSRVTGGSISNIDGAIQANGAANLFLLNPSGILFGPNATLNIGGSLIGATANSIQFADGVEFSAVNPTPTPLLTLSVPTGLQMGRSPAAIQVQGMGHRLAAANSPIAPYMPYAPYRGLQVRPSQTLALIGGNLELTGAILQAPGGRIEIGSVAQTGLVTLQSLNSGFSISYPNIVDFGSIKFTQKSSLEVGSLQSGSIQVQGGQVSLQDSSLISGTNFGPRSAGPIAISATQSLTLSDAIPSLNILGGIRQDNFGVGSGGSIIIHTPNLLVQSGATIFSRNYGSGPGGAVVLTTENIQIVGYAANAPEVFTRVGTLATAKGQGGNLTTSAQTLSLREGGFMGSVNFSDGIGGGNVVVNADTIAVQGTSPAQVSSAIGAYNLAKSGRSGDLMVNARRLSVRDGGVVSTSSISAGDAGRLTVNASESIAVSGYGSRNSYPSLITSSVPQPLAIYQQLFGLPTIPSGASGNVLINTPDLSISNGGGVSVSNYGTGKAGAVMINAGKIRLKDGGVINAITLSGDGGEILINADQIVMSNNAKISATAFGNSNIGNGGNIRINSSVIAGINNSDILANASQGYGGNIEITTQGILGLRFWDQPTLDSDITASSEFGVNGTVNIATPGIDPNAGLTVLPIEMLDPRQQIAKGCDSTQGSSFVATGRGGVPENPSQYISHDRSWSDWRSLAGVGRSGHGPTVASTVPPELIEATTWQLSPQGEPQLIAGNSMIATQRNLTCAGYSRSGHSLE